MPSALRAAFYHSTPQQLYGGQLDLLRYFQVCDRALLDPQVIVPAPGPFADRAAALGVPVTVLPLPAELARTGGALLHGNLVSRLRQAALLAPWSLRLARRLRRGRAQVLYANNRRAVLTTGAGARLAGVPVFWHIKQTAGRERMDALALRLVTAAAGCSLEVQQAFQQRHPSQAQRIGYLPYGVPLEAFTAAGADLRPALGIPAAAVVVGLAGSITPRKGTDLFVQAALRLADRHPQAHFLLAGDASSDSIAFKQEVLAAAAPLLAEGRFHAPGWLDDMPALYRSLDVLALPSRVEGFGLVVVEAAAAGLPCVRTDSGGHTETTIDGETGFVTAVDDLPAFTAALDRLLADSDLRERMSQAARAHALAHLGLDRFSAGLTTALQRTAGIQPPA